MREEAEAATVRLADYRPPAHLVESVALTFHLAPEATRVRAAIAFAPNPDRAGEGPPDLRLDGRKLRLVSAAIDGAELPRNAVAVDAEGLTVPAELLPEGGFAWTCETEIDPAANTALEGLYMSNGMYCTQCEPQGFRKVTFYPDRPDVMAPFRVRIEADPAATPVLLSNGNLIAAGPGWAEWEDPFRKPTYLFALVAGDLKAVEDHFVTASGRDVLLQIWVRDGDQGRCAYAMDALKRSMKWDEEAYGREYDLDRFMIVAVDDFNMGAMENKGLNVFNSKFVLASPETATDVDFKSIETIIAHEYFHNWTGNRITCRDWFQLCLKEGLTVFRDQSFSADQRSAGVKRIEDVLRLRAGQFREDAGPLAHPVRPEEYVEINNFYTATVYDKGAELVGMLRRLVGAGTYARALDLYFERHDGEAVTIEDWLRVFEEVSGRDLSQFLLWYRQAGTPRVKAETGWRDGTWRLRLSQSTPPTPGQPLKLPVPIPVAYGLLAQDGRTLAEGLLELDTAEAEFTWDLPEAPVPSLLRGFSAPVILERAATAEERAVLLAHDGDPFNRWEAGRAYALDILTALAKDPGAEVDPAWIAAMTAVAEGRTDDAALKALSLGLPGTEETVAHLARLGRTPDPVAIHHARKALEAALGRALGDRLDRLFADNAVPGPYSPDAGAAGKRALRARALALICARDGGAARAAEAHAAAADMTEAMSALSLLVAWDEGAAALDAFHGRWRGDRLVVDKWFTVQASLAPPESAVDLVGELAGHPDFDWRNPNRFRALVAAFAGNLAGFHREDGAGYRFVTDWLIKLDPVNPQTTAKIANLFGTWPMFDDARQARMRGELERLAATPDLSRDTGEIVGRLLRRDG